MLAETVDPGGGLVGLLVIVVLVLLAIYLIRRF
jgi:flagellar biogenesis protein FliO